MPIDSKDIKTSAAGGRKGFENAYQYLELCCTERNKSLPRDKLSDEDLAQSIEKLKDGLAFYFENANTVQNELILLHANAARRMMLAELLLVKLDGTWETSIPTNEAELTDRIQNEYFRVVEDVGLVNLVLPEGLLEAVQKTQTAPSPENSAKLRTILEEWVLTPENENGLILPDIVVSNKPFGSNISHQEINEFIHSRTVQTNILNHYQAKLDKLKYVCAEALEITSSEHSSSHHVLKKLWKLADDRFQQVQDFRNGLVPTLDIQDPELSNFELSSHKGNEFLMALLRDFTVWNENSPSLQIQDIERPYLSPMQHPALKKIETLRGKLKDALPLADNPAYRNDVPGVKILENGIKSWRSTIEKLVYRKNCDWDKMGDLSRINTVFGSADSMYFFNRVLRHIAPEHGWKIEQGAAGTALGDKGIRQAPSGTLNWNINMIRTKEPGLGLMAESKLDPITTHKVEKLTHPLYEVPRILHNGNNRSVTDTSGLNEQQIASFEQTALSTLGNIRKNFTNAPQKLNNLLEGSDHFIRNLHRGRSVLIPIINEMVIEAQAIITFDAAHKTQSPSIAALHAAQFEAYEIKTNRKIEALEKAGSPTEFLKKSLATLKELFAEFGPKLCTRETHITAGEYRQQDLDHVKELEACYQKSWGQEKDQGRKA